MKANLFEIKRFAVHDGGGIRTTVFFKGCPLKCVWCHNPEGLTIDKQLAYYSYKCLSCGECVSVCPVGAHKIRESKHFFNRDKCIACGRCESVCLGEALKLYGEEMTIDSLLSILLLDEDFYKNSGGGITLSGGECLLQADFCRELLKRLKERGLHTAVDTCGFVSQATLDKVIAYTDLFLYDIKAISENVHKRCTGQGNNLILENIKYLDLKGCKIEVRIPYVPDFNDEEIEKIAEFLCGLKNLVKVRVLPYHSYAASKYQSLEMLNELPSRIPENTEIETAKEILRKYCINVAN